MLCSGYFTGAEDYWTHFSGVGYDIHAGNEIDWGPCCRGPAALCPDAHYSTHLFTNMAEQYIVEHAETHGTGGGGVAPLFLYLAYQAMHSPTQAPEGYWARFNETIPDKQRRTVAGMVTGAHNRHRNTLNAMSPLPAALGNDLLASAFLGFSLAG